MSSGLGRGRFGALWLAGGGRHRSWLREVALDAGPSTGGHLPGALHHSVPSFLILILPFLSNFTECGPFPWPQPVQEQQHRVSATSTEPACGHPQRMPSGPKLDGQAGCLWEWQHLSLDAWEWFPSPGCAVCPQSPELGRN